MTIEALRTQMALLENDLHNRIRKAEDRARLAAAVAFTLEKRVRVLERRLGTSGNGNGKRK